MLTRKAYRPYNFLQLVLRTNKMLFVVVLITTVIRRKWIAGIASKEDLGGLIYALEFDAIEHLAQDTAEAPNIYSGVIVLTEQDDLGWAVPARYNVV